MLEVDIDKILPVTEARDSLNRIVDQVGGTDHIFVLTKNGKPSAVIVGVNHLGKLTGKTADELTSIAPKKASETPVVEEVNPISSPSVSDVGGSKPLDTPPVGSVGVSDVSAAGPSIQAGNEQQDQPIEVPNASNAPSPPLGATAPPSYAPTSSPGSWREAPESTNAPPAHPFAAAPPATSNQAPTTAPTENGALTSDSDLFV